MVVICSDTHVRCWHVTIHKYRKLFDSLRYCCGCMNMVDGDVSDSIITLCVWTWDISTCNLYCCENVFFLIISLTVWAWWSHWQLLHKLSPQRKQLWQQQEVLEPVWKPWKVWVCVCVCVSVSVCLCCVVLCCVCTSYEQQSWYICTIQRWCHNTHQDIFNPRTCTRP